MIAPAPAAPDEGPGQPIPWTEIHSDFDPFEGRRFRAGESVWTVVAITPEYLAELGFSSDSLLPRLAHGWLSFECGDEGRRYAPIPDNWLNMAPEELRALCERAAPVRRPPTR